MNRKLRSISVLILLFIGCLLFQGRASAAVTWVASGNQDTGTNSLSVPYPAGTVAGNLLVLVVGNKYPTNGPSTPAGWTLRAQARGGLGAAGNDSGEVYSTIFTKEAVGGESGNLTVTVTGANTSMARMFRYTKAAGTVWDIGATTGSDNSAGNPAGRNWSATGADNPGITTGDIMFVASALNGNAVTKWTQVITATNATFGAATERNDSVSGTGNDMGLIISEHPATAGTATAAPVYTMTASSGTPTTNSPTGASAMLRIREVLSAPTITQSFSPASMTVNSTSVLTITLTNPNAIDITGAAFTDTYPSGLVNAAAPSGATTCAGGTVTASGGGGSVALSGATIPASGSCTVTVTVTSAAVGSYVSPAFSVTSTNAPIATATTATLTVSLCFTDLFDRASPGSDWSVGYKSGTFGAPVLSGNRLRLTNNSTGASTWATLSRIFPAASNMVTIEFDQFAYGGSHGDGMAVVLSDASVGAEAGAFGGSLGYAQKSNPGSDCTTTGGCPGFTGGWLGIAIDEYGNFSTNAEGRYGGGSSPVGNSVAIRGSGTGMSGYRFLKGTNVLSPGVDSTSALATPHRYRIIVDHRDGTHVYTSVERSIDGGINYVPLIGCPPSATPGPPPGCVNPALDVKEPGYSQNPIPTNFTLSFTGSTGGSTNTHEIDNLKVCTALGQVTPTLHHIKIEHSGNACTSNSASITLKACANAACDSLYMGSVTVALSAVGTWSPASPVTFTGGQTTVTLTGTAGAKTLGTTSTTPVATDATECYSGTTQTCTLTFAACSFDAVETGAAAYTPIFTKLAGTAFNLDIRNLSGSNQTVSKVEIVDASSGTCNSFTSLSNSTTTVPSNFTGSQVKPFAFNSANAVRNARIRITSGAGTSCSTDNFAIRPTAFTVTTTATQTGTTGTPIFRAGNDPFSMTVTALPGYDGTPKLNLNSGSVTTTLANLGTVGGSAFSAASSATGAVTNATLTYSEVGNFSFAANAIYDDGFAVVDASKSNPECTSDFSNTPNANNKYGCMFGAPVVGPLGRFVPYQFVVVGQVANACSNFTYFGQPISIRRADDVTRAEVIEARNSGGGVTKNYSGATWGKGTVAFGLENSDDGSNRNGTSPVVAYSAGSYSAMAGSWINGIYTLAVAPPLNAAIQRPAAPTGASWGPFALLDIGVSVTDADVSTSPRIQLAEMDPVTSGTCAVCAYKKLTGSPLALRYGQLRLSNIYGSVSPLQMPVEAQYWTGKSWVKNVEDTSSCTSLSGLTSSYDTSGWPLPVMPAAISAGSATIPILPASNGTRVLTLNVPAWLKGTWDGVANANPSAKATFGVFSAEHKKMIHIRELY